jgi:hypothetical protein
MIIINHLCRRQQQQQHPQHQHQHQHNININSNNDNVSFNIDNNTLSSLMTEASYRRAVSSSPSLMQIS